MHQSINAQLVINEYSANKGLNDLGESFDWIELYNNSTDEADLSEYSLSDNLQDLDKWNLPNILLGPNEFIAICASGKNITQKEDHWETLVSAENLWKYFPAEEEPPANWNEITFDDSSWLWGPGGFGYGDSDDNTIVQGVSAIYLRREFGIEDLDDISTLLLHADFDDAFVAYINGVEIARSENIEGNPPAYDQNISIDLEASLYQGLLPDAFFFNSNQVNSLLQEGPNILAIQVHNFSQNSSDMSSNFYLSAGIVSDQTFYQETPAWFPDFTTITYYHSNFKIGLDETLVLSSDGLILDLVITDADLEFGISKGRQPDASTNWCYFQEPSPEASNNAANCFAGFAEVPQVNYESGWYDQSIDVTIEDQNADVHFTTNGDIPDQNDPLFNSAIVFSENAVLSLRAFSDSNFLPSKVVDRTFIFDQDNHGLPVISIHSDSLGIWGYTQGIYVSGPNAQASIPYFGSNFWQPWSRFSRMELFDQNKNKVAEEHFDLEIHGGWSRAEPQKSFRLDFKSEYTGNLEYQLFENRPDINSFNNINLRNGGQHNATDRLQDALISRLAFDAESDNVAYQGALVFLNGAYWGLYGIREKQDQHYINELYNVPTDSIDLLNSFGVLNGTADHFLESYELLMNEDINAPFYFNLFSQRFDTKNYIDYFIIQTYIQNMDWMGIAWGANNIKLWRPQTNQGKWRYMLFDTDAAFGYFGQNVFNNYIEFARSPMYPTMHSELFDRLLLNNQFRCEFANRYADLINTTFQSENLVNEMEILQDGIADAMPDHIARWSAPSSMNQWQSAMSNIINYNAARINQARNQLNTNLQLGQQVEISFELSPPNSGMITLNTIPLEEFPWDGIYNTECPVIIEAIPAEGYQFQNWSSNDHFTQVSVDPIEIVQLFSSDTFTANFTLESTNLEEIEKSAITFFPNPSKGLFSVLNENDILIEKIFLFDAKGSLILETEFLGEQIDLSGYEKGPYLLKIISEKGVLHKRLLVQ